VNIALMEARPTIYEDDRTLAAVPPSVLNVMTAARSSSPLIATPETARAIASFAVDGVVGGNLSLRITVK
jgi:hypothetical protein